MTWVHRFRIREYARTALWIIPLGFAVAGLLLGMVVWRLDRWGRWTLLGIEPSGATALTAAIVGAMITFVGIVFSLLLVGVQFASAQLTPRAIRLALSDRLNKLALGVFVGTLMYTLIVMARITNSFVPQLGVLGAAVLVVVSLVAFLALISHVGVALRPAHVVAGTGAEGRRTLDAMYREPFGGASTDDAPDVVGDHRGAPRIVVSPAPPGVVLAVDIEGLVAEARRCDARVELIPAVGDFVPSGAPLFRVHETATPVDERRLRSSVALGRERTLEQDPTFAFRILVDVAIKALSPAVNDPTSAVMALDQLHDLLLGVGGRRLEVGRHRDGSGRVRLAIEMPTWDDYVSLAVDEIRHYGAGSVQIARRLRALLEDLLATVPEPRKATVREELDLLARSVDRSFRDAEDRGRAQVADRQGLGS